MERNLPNRREHLQVVVTIEIRATGIGHEVEVTGTGVQAQDHLEEIQSMVVEANPKVNIPNAINMTGRTGTVEIKETTEGTTEGTTEETEKDRKS